MKFLTVGGRGVCMSIRGVRIRDCMERSMPGIISLGRLSRLLYLSLRSINIYM
jgi:hypothetical protein